jgi:hypothetical protein
LINKVESIPIDIDDYYRPFTIMRRNKIEKYITSSDYWANELSIYALCDELQINVIPIEKNKSNNRYNLRIPYANLNKDKNFLSFYSFSLKFLYVFLRNDLMKTGTLAFEHSGNSLYI